MFTVLTKLSCQMYIINTIFHTKYKGNKKVGLKKKGTTKPLLQHMHTGGDTVCVSHTEISHTQKSGKEGDDAIELARGARGMSKCS